MDRNLVALLAVVVLIALAGCSGADGGPAGDGGDGGAAAGAGSGDWCPAGQSMQMSNPQTGEQASWQVQGTVQQDGRQLCRVSWETNQGEVQRMELLFTQDESYRKMVTYDGNGNVLNEVVLTGGSGDGTSGTDGGSGDGAGGGIYGDGSTAAGTGDWCGEAATMQFSDPETGEQVSWNVQGMVQHEGRQVCQAVWETNQGDIRRIEMYFSEDRSYQKMIYYDAEGNVVNEVEMGSG